MGEKKKDHRPKFRSAAKQAGWDHMNKRLHEARTKLRDNTWKLADLAREQSLLKADIAAIQQVMHELWKGKP